MIKNEIPLDHQLHCINCRKKQDDLDRMHIHMGVFNRIVIGFWCVDCGHENEFTITRASDHFGYYFEHL